MGFNASADGTQAIFQVGGTPRLTLDSSGNAIVTATPAQGDNSKKLINSEFFMQNSFGQSQSWQDVSASRVLGTTYYNTTGKPIAISACITGASTSGVCSVVVLVNGIIVLQGITSESNGVTWLGFGNTFVTWVPAGGSYSISNNTLTNTITHWVEFK
jgi:hypothetical protein